MSSTDLKPRFKWKTAEGQILEIEEMETRHVYMCAKMLYNHLAVHRGWKPISYTRSYGGFHWMSSHKPNVLAYQCVVFLLEVRRRGDLPDRFRTDYDLIIEELRNQFQKKLPDIGRELATLGG
jgi:hypothetical protein